MKFDDKEAARCHRVSFDYDAREYTINNGDIRELPPQVKTITLEVEEG